MWATEGWLGSFGSREGSGGGDTLRGSRCSRRMSLGSSQTRLDSNPSSSAV